MVAGVDLQVRSGDSLVAGEGPREEETSKRGETVRAGPEGDAPLDCVSIRLGHVIVGSVLQGGSGSKRAAAIAAHIEARPRCSCRRDDLARIVEATVDHLDEWIPAAPSRGAPPAESMRMSMS